MTFTPFKCFYYLSSECKLQKREGEQGVQKINICTNQHTKIFPYCLLVSPSSRLFPFIRKDQLSHSSALM